MNRRGFFAALTGGIFGSLLKRVTSWKPYAKGAPFNVELKPQDKLQFSPKFYEVTVTWIKHE